MRYVLLTSESADVARGSGTAMAVARLRAALAAEDVVVPVVRPERLWPSQTLARWTFNRGLRSRRFLDVDAVLGVNGDGWMAADRWRAPFVVLIKALYGGALEYEHGLTNRLLRLHARWEAAGAQRANAVVAPSQFAAAAVARRYSVDSARIHVVPEPFDAAVWRAALPVRERAGNRVLCVAHLYARKRIADLIRAWPVVVSERPDARIDIAGDGPEMRRLAHLARGLPGLFLHGHVEPAALPELYARADVFCLPSAQETFGYAVVEAMASGLPVVYADAGALPEMCAGAVAEPVTSGDTDALAAALLRAMDADHLQRAAAVNPERAGRFAPPAVAAQLMQVVARAAAI
ncbi:MAG TPA: glycosyltransferase family 4 protein [Candidatus Dormibacteraeota bacterium]